MAHRWLIFTLASAFLLGSQTLAQTAALVEPDIKTPFAAGNPSCSQPEKLSIPRRLVERAKLKARLVNILRESLYDDAKGIINVARDREIRTLASKLKDE